MKCDPGQDGCQQCQRRSLRCMATDRITGNTHERGETSRLRHDIEKLRAQVNAYYRQFGPLPAGYSLPGQYQAYAPPNGYTKYVNRSHAGLMNWCLMRILTSAPPAIRLKHNKSPRESNMKMQMLGDQKSQMDRIEDQSTKLPSIL